MPFDNIMHRAKILKKDHVDYCVVFIDFGNEYTVHVDDIYELPDEFKMVNKNIFSLVLH